MTALTHNSLQSKTVTNHDVGAATLHGTYCRLVRSDRVLGSVPPIPFDVKEIELHAVEDAAGTATQRTPGHPSSSMTGVTGRTARSALGLAGLLPYPSPPQPHPSPTARPLRSTRPSNIYTNGQKASTYET